MQTVEDYYKQVEYSSIDEIGIRPWDYYLIRALEVTSFFNNPVILKTDAFNEAEGYPENGGIAACLTDFERVDLLEYDIATMVKAKRVIGQRDDVTFTRGDIRELPFKENTYDVVMDLSTLDHVEPSDVPTVLDEYKRVLKDTGILLLIAWYEVIKGPQPKEWRAENQYYFNEEEVLKLVNKRFTLHHNHTFHRNFNDEYMTCMVCTK